MKNILVSVLFILACYGMAVAAPQSQVPYPGGSLTDQAATSDLKAKIALLQKELGEAKAGAVAIATERDQFKEKLLEAEFGRDGRFEQSEALKRLSLELKQAHGQVDDLARVVASLKADLAVAKNWGAQMLAELGMWRSGKPNPFGLPAANVVSEPIKAPAPSAEAAQLQGELGRAKVEDDN